MGKDNKGCMCVSIRVDYALILDYCRKLSLIALIKQKID